MASFAEKFWSRIFGIGLCNHEFQDRAPNRSSEAYRNLEIKITATQFWFYGALAFTFIIYIALALTPSNYGMGLKYLGVEYAPLLGNAKAIRSDEWAVLTPLFQIAVRGHFSTIDQVSPYHETLKGFWALPIFDWSLIFKPQLWAFWIVPPAFAYSTYFGVMWASFIVGYTALLQRLGATFSVAALGSIVLLMSHFVQVWWTSDAPTFALAPWPLVVFLTPLRPMVKLPLLFWASCVWIFGMLYPPFIIGAASAFIVLLLTFRRDALTKSNIICATVSTASTVLVVFFYFGELVSIMENTIYPGQRNVGGGGFPLAMLWAHVFPFATTANFNPLLANSNECEVSVVATMVPLATLCFCRAPESLSFTREQKTSLAIFALGFSAIIAWMLVPIPAVLGKLLLWNVVQPIRMAWGFGLLTTLSLLVCISKVEFKASLLRFYVFSTVLILSWLISKMLFHIYLQETAAQLLPLLQSSYFDLLPIPIFGAALLIAFYARLGADRSVILIASALVGAFTFGSFNPFQQAFPIFNIPDSQFQASLREQLKTNPNGWAVVPGMYGAVLNGAGIPSINHTLPVPQMAFFRHVFPQLNDGQLNEAFNRYAHIIPTKEGGFVNQSPDSVNVPIEAFQRLVPKL